MSRCTICNKLLTNEEAIRKHRVTKQELGLCDECRGAVEQVQRIPTVLGHSDTYDDESDFQALFSDAEYNIGN